MRAYFLYNISMRKWVYKVVSILLSALVLGASADIAFALPKKLPKLKGGKRPRITVPKTLGTRNLPPTPVVRPNVATQVERATAVQAAKAVTTPSVAPAHALQETPATPAVQDTGTNLTGTQVLAQYFPTWRQELGGMFSKEQLDAVEKAFAATDEWMFVRGEDGELKARNKDEWDYEARFLTILQNSGVSFTDKQVKQLIGGKGIKGFTFKICFFRMKATGFSCAKDTKPRQAISKNGHILSREEMTQEEVQEVNIGIGLHTHCKHPLVQAYLQENRLQAGNKTPEEYVALARQYPTKPRSVIYRDGLRLSREEMTPEEVQEVNIGLGLNTHRNHPLVQAYLQENHLSAKSKTPEEYVALARQYPTKPRQSISRGGHILSREEMTPEEVQEMNIGKGLNNYRNHPLVKAYLEENRLKAESKTPEEYVALARQYPTKPRAQISKNGHRLSREEMTPEEVQEMNIGKGLAKHSKHPLVQAYLKENRRIPEAQTTPQLYTTLITHIKAYGHYPTESENSLHNIIYKRLRYYESTMIDGKYADPWLQKIYELKQWSERVKRGEVDWDKFPGLFKKHRRTIGEMREQGQLPPKETQKELEQLSADEQEAIEQMADNMLTLWEDFEGVWWKQNHKHIITTPQTQMAFNTVLKTVQTQVPGATNVNISNVLEQVNGMQLGQDGPDYYRVIYRGNNPRIPRAEDFHNVEEITGLPQQYAQPAYKLNAQHISLDGDDEMVYNMFLTQGVTDREMNGVIDSLTPAGWEVRIGAHELLNEIKQGFIHIHIEQVVPTTEEDAQDISNVLRVDLRALTQGKNPQQVAKTLRYLFAKYLKEDGHQALNNIQKAF